MAGALHSQRGLRVAKITGDVLGEFTIQASKAESAATGGVKKKLRAKSVRTLACDGVDINHVDVWFQDESRIGQQGSQTRIWAPTGTRPRVVKQQQFLYSYIFGAVCPAQKTCAALVVPYVSYEILKAQLHEEANI